MTRSTVRLLAALLAVLAVVASGAAAYSYQRLDRLDAAHADRLAAAAAAEQFAARLTTYTHEEVDEHQEEMGALLTTAGRTQFEQDMEQVRILWEEAEETSEGQAQASAVSHADPDDAVVLVVADAQVENLLGSYRRHQRFRVELDKVDGEWLVADFEAMGAVVQ